LLGYRAKALLAELEQPHGPRNGGTRPALTERLTPTSAALLRWWFSGAVSRTREDNFHPGQREAILHVVLAHEVFGDCDPQRLSQLAGMTDPAAIAAPPARDMRLSLRSAPACGLRWVLQALLVWQWANHMAARAAGREDTRFSDRFSVLVPAAQRQHWEDRLLGPVAVAGLRTVGDTGVLRRMRLFLPPALRAPFRFWLLMQVCVGDALRVLADDTTDAAATLVAGRGPRLACGLPAPVFAGTGAVPLQAPPSLRVTWLDDAQAGRDEEITHHGTCVADFGPARAIRYGVAKLPVLACAPARLPLPDPATADIEARHGARPALRRDHTAQLRLGLRALAQRAAGFATIDPVRMPRMRVLCDSPGLLRAARARLRDLGVAARDIAATGCTPDHTRIDFGLLSPTSASSSPPPDPRVCVLVVLRSHAPGAGERAPSQAVGMPALWPEPELARLRAGNRERAAFGQPPDTLLDVLTVVEHRDALPLYTPWRQLGLAALDPRAPEAVPPIGDVVVTTLRPDAARFEITLPPTCVDIAALETPERLSALPRRLLRASRSLPVRKSIHPRAGWDEDDNGLRRGFIEAAERDPDIDSHCLLDPRRHACRHRDTLLALGMDGRGRVDALARTATHVFLIEFMADRPGGAAHEDGGERALRLWRRRTNTLPAGQRDHRLWRRVKLQTPLFWSCKRHGVPLSALLEALADTRSLVVPVAAPPAASATVPPAPAV
jgi:antitoxin (DNA-binding transcriptional repressor) of toxin-antitoxin stability system